MNEQSILKRILLACSTGTSRLFRQNTGMGWIGKSKKYHVRCTVEIHPGDVIIRKARPFRAGFVGMSDLIGWRSVAVTPEMIGQVLAIYTAVEVKSSTGRLTKEQRTFIAMVRTAGGIAGVARSADEAMEMLGGAPDPPLSVCNCKYPAPGLFGASFWTKCEECKLPLSAEMCARRGIKC